MPVTQVSHAGYGVLRTVQMIREHDALVFQHITNGDAWRIFIQADDYLTCVIIDRDDFATIISGCLNDNVTLA